MRRIIAGRGAENDDLKRHGERALEEVRRIIIGRSAENEEWKRRREPGCEDVRVIRIGRGVENNDLKRHTVADIGSVGVQKTSLSEPMFSEITVYYCVLNNI